MQPEEMICRGKSVEGKWVYGYYFTALNKQLITVVESAAVINNYIIKNPESIGRTTMLIDKNGTTVFEGDIVKAITLDTAEEVFAIVRYGKFQDVNADDDDWFIGFYLETEEYNATIYACCGIVMNYIEVVGNIYDNPELIKTKGERQ